MLKTDPKKVPSQFFFANSSGYNWPNFLWKKKFPLHNPFKVDDIADQKKKYTFFSLLCKGVQGKDVKIIINPRFYFTDTRKKNMKLL